MRDGRCTICEIASFDQNAGLLEQLVHSERKRKDLWAPKVNLFLFLMVGLEIVLCTSESANEAETDREESHEGEVSVSNCTALCCINIDKAYQLVKKHHLSQLASNKRNFQLQWFRKFSWLAVCTASKRVCGLYCRYAAQHRMKIFF